MVTHRKYSEKENSQRWITNGVARQGEMLFTELVIPVLQDERVLQARDATQWLGGGWWWCLLSMYKALDLILAPQKKKSAIKCFIY